MACIMISANSQIGRRMQSYKSKETLEQEREAVGGPQRHPHPRAPSFPVLLTPSTPRPANYVPPRQNHSLDPTPLI